MRWLVCLVLVLKTKGSEKN